MAKILDPDLLNQGVEVEFLTGSRLIRLNVAGNLSDVGTGADTGVSMQTLYSFTKEEWRDDDNLIRFPFPLLSITSEQFELINGWDLSGSLSKNLIRDAGWALKNTAGNSLEEWMNITTLGSFQSSDDQSYYAQTSSLTDAPSQFVLSGEVNQAVQVYASGSENYDFRDYFAIYLREQGKTYAFYNLNDEQNIDLLTYRKFALPLSNGLDLKVTVADTGIDANSDGTADVAPYSGMSITYYSGSAQSRTIGGVPYNFSIIINGNNGDAEEIYEFVQWSLRQTVDIDAGAGERRGEIAEELLEFIGDTLRTQFTSIGGVYIDNFLSVDTNRIEFTDNTNTIRTFPFIAAGNINFNDNLRNDSAAIYKVFFLDDDDGDDLGRDFGTQDAIIIEQYNGGTPIPFTGSVASSASFAFDYDYDNNIQRGSAASGSDAPFAAVALGLSTAQWTVAFGNIGRTTANSINFVSNLERNYLNP
jgi:hypothetical protein